MFVQDLSRGFFACKGFMKFLLLCDIFWFESSSLSLFSF